MFVIYYVTKDPGRKNDLDSAPGPSPRRPPAVGLSNPSSDDRTPSLGFFITCRLICVVSRV